MGCKDDDLQKQVDELNDRVISLETLCAQMNTNISSMQAILNVVQQQDYITGITPMEENAVIIGYIITFAKNKSITIYNGKNGSSLSAKKGIDGIYYWELNGSWLLDNDGKQMKVSGVTPQLKIEDGHWLVSVDEGKTWDDAGEATGDSFFKEVDNSADDFVRFVFADGTEVQVPKKETFAISFSEPLPLKITAGETVEIAYTLSRGDEKTLVKTITSNGWNASVKKKDNLSGTISITAPTPITDDEVLVFISDGKEKTVMSAISFCIVILENVQDNTVKVSGGEGNLDLEVTSNMEIKAVPKNEWIVLDEGPLSRSLVTNNFHFTIQTNEGEQNRTGYIEVQDMGGKVFKTITVIQGNALEEEIAKEREILIKFYYATNGDQWGNNTNWCSDKPVGEWFGIVVDHQGFVMSIDFHEQNNNLSGHLIPELGELSHLSRFQIISSKVSGTIPEEFCNLKELCYLELAYNKLLTGKIPSSIGQLKKLYFLRLSGCQLTGEIPSSIWQLPNLSRLELDDNQLTGELPANMNDLKELGYLDLSNNQLTGEIPSTICQLTNMSSLDLSDNRLSGEIPRDIGNLQKLYSLNLGNIYSGNNQLVGSIPTSIKQCSKLTLIDLRSNQLQGDMMLDFFLQNCDAIYLNNNNLTGEIPARLATWLDERESWSIDVSNNCLSGTIPLEVVSTDLWSTVKENIVPQNTGYQLEMPTVYETKDYSKDGQVIILQKATEGNGVNIVISGDGFADIDFENGHFDEVMNKTVEVLFSLEPMKSFRHLFNIYVVKAVSKNNIYIEKSETAFNCKYNSNFITYDQSVINNKYAPKVKNFNISRDVFIIIINAYERVGITYMMYPDGYNTMICARGFKYPTVNDPDAFRNTVCHEFGHAFGKLADEYWYKGAGSLDERGKETILKEHSMDMSVNIDITGDPNKVAWSHFIADERYHDENIGVFEGGYLYAKDVWRPTENSLMNTDIGDVPFNAPSREAIYKRIMKQAYGDDWQYDYEKFVEYDAINRSSVPKLLRRVNTPVIPKDYKPLPPPVIVYK